MESSPSSNLQFYDLHDQPGEPIAGPVEGRNCGIAINIAKELVPSASLKLSGLPLPVLESEVSAYSEWPACGPGFYQLSFECESISEHRTITIMPRYFSESDIAFVIRDLSEVLPNTIATQLNRCGAELVVLQSSDYESTIRNEYLRLRHAIVGTNDSLGMLQILQMLQRNSQKVLVPRLDLRSVNKLRRPDISKLPQAMSIPGNLVSADKLYQMYDVVVESSFSAYENRLVKAYVLALRGRLSMLQSQLPLVQAELSMSTELESLAYEFHLAYMRATFLREVPALSSVRITMVLLKNPAYRAVLEGYLVLNKPSTVTLQEPAIAMPLNNFPYLYQRWVSFKVLSALLQVCAETRFRCINHYWIKSYIKGTNIEVINDGRPGVQFLHKASGRQISFVPWSASAVPNVFGQQSATGAAIVVETPGKPAAILVFDPKYWVDSKKVKAKAKRKKSTKAKTEENEATEMLTVLEPRRDDVEEIQRVKEQLKASIGSTSEIQYSAILYPGERKQLAEDFDALPAHPRDGAALQENVCEVLRRFLASS